MMGRHRANYSLMVYGTGSPDRSRSTQIVMNVRNYSAADIEARLTPNLIVFFAWSPKQLWSRWKAIGLPMHAGEIEYKVMRLPV